MASYDNDNKPFQPGSHCFVGGATKMCGAALFRLRKEDFTAHRTADGVTPDWPVAKAFEAESAATQNADIKSFLDKSIPVIEEHLKIITAMIT